MIAIIMGWSFLLGYLTNEQLHYEKCKAQDFKTEACEKSLKLDKYGR